jgi:hypothetical protein
MDGMGNMTWVVWAIVIGTGVAAVWWWLGRPVRYRNVLPQQLEEFFHQWIRKLDHGSLIFVRDEQLGHFAQFAVYRSAMTPVIQLALPEVDWSSSSFPDVRSALGRAGFETRVESTEVEEIPSFLICELPLESVDVARDAARVAEVVLDAVGSDVSAGFTVWCEGGHASDAAMSDLGVLQSHRNPIVRRWAKRRMVKMQKRNEK